MCRLRQSVTPALKIGGWQPRVLLKSCADRRMPLEFAKGDFTSLQVFSILEKIRPNHWVNKKYVLLYLVLSFCAFKSGLYDCIILHGVKIFIKQPGRMENVSDRRSKKV